MPTKPESQSIDEYRWIWNCVCYSNHQSLTHHRITPRDTFSAHDYRLSHMKVSKFGALQSWRYQTSLKTVWQNLCKTNIKAGGVVPHRPHLSFHRATSCSIIHDLTSDRSHIYEIPWDGSTQVYTIGGDRQGEGRVLYILLDANRWKTHSHRKLISNFLNFSSFLLLMT